jgi:hypothetical protein
LHRVAATAFAAKQVDPSLVEVASTPKGRILPASSPASRYGARSETLRRLKGTVFFLDTGEATFAVTACHLVSGFFEDAEKQTTVISVAAHGKTALPIPMKERLIDMCPEIDVATFRVRSDELSYLNKRPLRGLQFGRPDWL